VIGNLIAALLLGNLNQIYFFIVMGFIALSSALLFSLLRRPIKQIN
jgi:hypothetical protein